jgi:hypothetical protein
MFNLREILKESSLINAPLLMMKSGKMFSEFYRRTKDSEFLSKPGIKILGFLWLSACEVKKRNFIYTCREWSACFYARVT